MHQKFLFIRRYLVGKTLKDESGFGVTITGVEKKAEHLYFSVHYLEDVYLSSSFKRYGREVLFDYMEKYYHIRCTQITIREDVRYGVFR
jgi:hypothetical protein